MTEDDEESEDEEELESTPEDVADELFDLNFEERRRENQAHAKFEDSEVIGQAGNLYQESEFARPAEAIDLVSNGLGFDQEEATRLLSIYARIFTEFSGYASGRADTDGREFFSRGPSRRSPNRRESHEARDSPIIDFRLEILSSLECNGRDR